MSRAGFPLSSDPVGKTRVWELTQRQLSTLSWNHSTVKSQLWSPVQVCWYTEGSLLQLTLQGWVLGTLGEVGECGPWVLGIALQLLLSLPSPPLWSSQAGVKRCPTLQKWWMAPCSPRLNFPSVDTLNFTTLLPLTMNCDELLDPVHPKTRYFRVECWEGRGGKRVLSKYLSQRTWEKHVAGFLLSKLSLRSPTPGLQETLFLVLPPLEHYSPAPKTSKTFAAWASMPRLSVGRQHSKEASQSGTPVPLPILSPAHWLQGHPLSPFLHPGKLSLQV